MSFGDLRSEFVLELGNKYSGGDMLLGCFSLRTSDPAT